MATVFSGDTRPFTVTITGVSIGAGATVRAAWVSLRTQEAIGVVTAQTDGGLASWADGVVGVVFTQATMDALASYVGHPVVLEVEVDDGGTKTYQAPFTVKKGVIE